MTTYTDPAAYLARTTVEVRRADDGTVAVAHKPVATVAYLREAARVMRERARAATPGPWTAHPDGLVWPRVAGDPVSGSADPADAEHIASWRPGVALAVADWLDKAADREQEHHDRCRDSGDDPGEPQPGDEAYGALVIARAYLGVDR